MEDKEQLIYSVAAKGDLKRALKDIFSTWPNLRDITFRLSDYMDDIIPGKDGVPLLQSCLSDAVKGYKEVSPVDFGTEKQMIAFIKGLVEKAPDFVSVSLSSTADLPDVWEPFNETIQAFRGRFGEVSIHQEPYSLANPDSVRLMLLARIINTRDLQWIDEQVGLNKLLESAA